MTPPTPWGNALMKLKNNTLHANTIKYLVKASKHLAKSSYVCKMEQIVNKTLKNFFKYRYNFRFFKKISSANQLFPIYFKWRTTCNKQILTT
ncbi:MAG: hypothetical protein A2268_01630 [Candidatus Raymondbacteria bacterium RifOxyA12_full_50_37]|uniref:Uncharacterized protein n=1 Tax=Candidatus Raymondbacteria bacterium RIFOXYD12_FULL_49_13 TaxID=1817890 RepID=A0A1F7F9T3_UNCRA|nr:MAG: hypothetical protein A2268_01630 [Candidatus Raymondbacteria bacterium RifOxyA12_full_50_37]OGJ87766.1 MAG: hypothetical protein A2248_07235 [Candidatus Raymondbacteria bacterium RIFOXYA2_FULL_49_16]OGJ95644.1 MAG: hypothetical protein A2453_13230 [Candidatus Raymondbacteria bacterium RIFOXYC2_FULL_50_21]OGJ99681.1 MAG: hypothetical protein A2487_11195 [Candidatus Raymondbacteria bacterium RifOxyC12_full_50_8]OGK03415.1 MAG: hypothetical protein A2519_15510 [Candidatus Raymondbacteria b